MRSKNGGFTLIELMIVVAIVAILATIAYPSYTSFVRKARRADAEKELMTLAQLNQRRFLDTRAYTSTVSDLLAPISPSVSPYYNISISVDAGPPASFSISAAPYGAQTKDDCKTLTLTSSGSKTSSGGSNCW
jgi:type IV pilus assembly protein PilE